MDVIDFRVRLRTEQMLKPWNPDNPAPHFEEYIRLYKMEPRLSEMKLPDFVSNMHVQGISKGVVCGGSIEDNDHLMEITHIIRGKEHLTNQTRQEFMYKNFGWEYPEAIHYGRLKISGASLSKSAILQGLRTGSINTGMIRDLPPCRL